MWNLKFAQKMCRSLKFMIQATSCSWEDLKFKRMVGSLRVKEYCILVLLTPPRVFLINNFTET